MFKVIFTTVFLSMAFLTLNAQTVSIGPMLGGNFSSVSDANNSKGLLGLSAGAFLNYSINEKIGLNAKVLFSQMGVASSVSDQSIRLNYLQIPITGVYFFGTTGNAFRPKVFLGPYVGFLLGAKNQDDLDLKDSFKSLDFGGQVGLGFNYSLKNRTWLNVDAGYAAGFANIFDNTIIKGKNNAFSLNVGLSFPLSGS